MFCRKSFKQGGQTERVCSEKFFEFLLFPFSSDKLKHRGLCVGVLLVFVLLIFKGLRNMQVL